MSKRNRGSEESSLTLSPGHALFHPETQAPVPTPAGPWRGPLADRQERRPWPRAEVAERWGGRTAGGSDLAWPLQLPPSRASVPSLGLRKPMEGLHEPSTVTPQERPPHGIVTLPLRKDTLVFSVNSDRSLRYVLTLPAAVLPT